MSCEGFEILPGQDKRFEEDLESFVCSYKRGLYKRYFQGNYLILVKQTILLAYENSDSESQQLYQVKAHDVRSMAASLAFRGGVSLNEIPEACFWKPHNTFTNFYLKDLCWHNGQILKLGPIVSAQLVIDL